MTLGFKLYNEVLSWPLNWFQKPPEAVPEVVNYKIFLGEHVPRHPPPLFWCAYARHCSTLKLVGAHAECFLRPCNILFSYER